MVSRAAPIPIAELRAVIVQIRAFERAQPPRAAWRQLAATAAFLTILLISLRAATNPAFLLSSNDFQENRMRSFAKAAVVSSIVAITSGAAAQNAVQWRVQDGGNGHWYRGVAFPSTVAVTWSAAREMAVNMGADLAALTSTAEANWVYAQVVSSTALWQGDMGPYIGLYQTTGAPEPDGGWRWVDGSNFTESVPWYWNQPDNYAASCGGDQFAAYWTGGPWFAAPRNFVGDIAGNGFCCCTSGLDRIPSALMEWSADCNNDGLVDYGQILAGQLADTNQNGVPDTCEVDPCPGDITGNNSVDGVDLAALLAAWGGGKSQYDCDVDNDGLVGGSDLAVVLAGWGACP